MKKQPLAGLAAAMALGAHAQPVPAPSAPLLAFQPLDAIVVTAARTPQRAADALRDVEVITRETIDLAGPISVAELLQRQALVEFRGTGGPGQPAGLFLRGANAGQTLVLIDGLRAGSATVGTTSLENIPLDLVERIEVVKGPLSSLYGPDAIGGVVQVFTRASAKPRLFATLGYGTDADSRLAAGFTAIEGALTASFSAGARRVDAPSATNARAFCHDPDRDPYENAFANLHAEARLARDESLAFAAFASRGRARFDGCPDAQGRFANDRNVQTISGASVQSSMLYAPGWESRLRVGQGRDALAIESATPARFETRQDQASWTHEFATPAGRVLAAVETLRQKVLSDTGFTRTRRTTNSAWISADESWKGWKLEASARRDDDDQFGTHDTGAVSLGATWPGVALVSATVGRGFRAPTFFDLYAPASDFYVANPDLRPERSRSREVGVRSLSGGAWRWRLTAFDHRIEDLIAYVFPTVLNVRRARIRGLEAEAEATLWGTRVRASLAAQRPRDEDTGLLLQGRARRFGRVELSRSFGAWRLAAGLTASGPRFDSADESPASRLPGYAIADASVRWRIDRHWSAELTGTNLADRRYEHTVGYDAPRRAVLLNLRYEAP